ncbi:MAG: hypothetical protein J6Y43_05375, partial [Clostridia bacterium]|nr:hypothetical protein [Clostridia bacterium]
KQCKRGLYESFQKILITYIIDCLPGIFRCGAFLRFGKDRKSGFYVYSFRRIYKIRQCGR